MDLSILNFVFITKAATPGVYWINLNAVTKRKFHAPHKTRAPIIQLVVGQTNGAILDERRRPWYLCILFKEEQ